MDFFFLDKLVQNVDYLNLKSLTVCKAKCSSTSSSDQESVFEVSGRNLSNNLVWSWTKHKVAMAMTSRETKVKTAAVMWKYMCQSSR